VGADGSKRTFAARLDTIPTGSFLRWQGTSAAVASSGGGTAGLTLRPWTPAGYGPAIEVADAQGTADVLTPETIVDVLRAGYRPCEQPLLADTVLPR
jgi:hypothetical protein